MKNNQTILNKRTIIRKKISIKKNLDKILTQVILIILSIIMVFPVLWTILSSVKTEKEMFSSPPVWIPTQLSFAGYSAAFLSQPMFRFIFNTIIIAFCSIFVSVVLGSIAAYGFSRFNFKYKNTLLYSILITMMFPGLTNLIPLYNVASKLHLIDTYTVVVILYLPMLLPMTIWIMKSFIDTIPMTLDEAATIDGCSNIGIFFKVVLPIARPGLVAIIVINFVSCWNEFMTAMIFLGDSDLKTITVGLYNFMGMEGDSYAPLLSAAVVALVPVIIIFLILRNSFMKGMLEGALKG